MSVTINPITALDWGEIEQRLVDWSHDITGLDAVWADENAPQPDKNYVLLDWLVVPEAIGDDYLLSDAVTGDQTLSRFLEGVRHGMLNVQVFTQSSRANESALRYCDMLQATIVVDQVRSKYFAPLMAIWDYTQVKRIANYVQDKRFKSRAGFDLSLGFGAGARTTERQPLVEGVGYIVGAAVTGVIRAGSVTAQGTVLVEES